MNLDDQRVLIEIVDRLSRIEAKQDYMQAALDAHSIQDKELRDEVDDVRSAVLKGQAQLSLLKWMVGVGVALAAAVARFVR